MPCDHFSIALPQQGAQVEEGMTVVEVVIAPPLRDDHQVRLLVNGEISQKALHSDVFWLTGLPQGGTRSRQNAGEQPAFTAPLGSGDDYGSLRAL